MGEKKREQERDTRESERVGESGLEREGGTSGREKE